ncbi:serine/threonine-protein kinase Nek3 isoform X4 [Ambystoma mexicanum]|uniref:serine/threonine-protein kinase Nek3 isoform X4 n=1 Tax=Ambystoma mexicanum TaxID=8296 RepID=UPI0037E9781E
MDQYTLLKTIGEGSFGRALLVQQESSHHKYVMKEVRLPKSPDGIRNSRQEAILLAKMRHPNIVAFKESFEDGHLYIVMEYCDGGDLLQAIKQQKGNRFPEHMILQWFVQLCRGVKHIHDKRVLHRDIKSKNIFLTQHGHVKLGDFGSARLLISAKANACTYVGTPYYVPPEIWENTPYNNKSDIWSLGCVLYELCTLKHPFQANSWKNLIRKICQGSYSPLPSQYSYELHYLLKQMFKRSPKDRPSASTILSRSSLAKYIKQCLPAEELADFEEQLKKEAEGDSNNLLGNIPEGDLEIGKEGNLPYIAQRKKWGSGPSNSVLNCLENASILKSSIKAEESESGGVIKFNESRSRKQWVKESPETLLNILMNADLSFAFQTYTIYKPAGAAHLSGPLSDDMDAQDTTDSREEDIAVDQERFEPRSDEEDTEFEEEDDDPDWLSALKLMVENQ